MDLASGDFVRASPPPRPLLTQDFWAFDFDRDSIRKLRERKLYTHHLKLSTRLFRLAILLAILAIPTLLCGYSVSFKVALQFWIMLLIAIVPMVGGVFLITKYFGTRQKLAALLTAFLIGFTFFAFSFVGSLIDGRASGWQQILRVSSIAGIMGFVVPFIYIPIYAIIIRIRKKMP